MQQVIVSYMDGISILAIDVHHVLCLNVYFASLQTFIFYSPGVSRIIISWSYI